MLKMLILENNFHEKSAFALFIKFVALEKGALRYFATPYTNKLANNHLCMGLWASWIVNLIHSYHITKIAS